uniref:GAF domain-containing protein n=1 Tax=Tetranychus urticae TaxID=32264 RepID=T1K849_TETUR
MTSHSPLGHSKQSNQQISSQSQAKQQTHRQYQRSYSEDLKSSRILETGETTCCPTDAPTIAQALWRPLWPPGWRPRGSLSSSSNKCNTNTNSSTNSNSNSSSNSNNNNYNKRTTSIFSNNNKSDYHNITSNTGNTLKNIFKRPLIVMSEHREDHRSGSSGVSVADVSKSGTSNEEEISRQRTSTDSGIISGKGGGGATKEGINRSLSSVNENCCVSVNTASNLSCVSESCFNCTQQSKSSKQQQTSSQTSSPSTTSTTAPNNRLITLSSGRLRLGPTSNDVTSSVEEYESMEAWLDEHPKFLCDYVIRKAPRSTIDAWILAHSIPHSGSSCGTATNSSASAPASGAATPVRKISAHEFEKGSLFLPPMVSTTEEGIPTFLQPPTRDDYHPSSHYSPHSPHQQQSFLNSNLSTSDYSYLSSSSLGPSLTLRQPLTSLSSPTSSSISSSSVCAATAETAALLQATSSTAATPLTSSSSPLTDISFPSSSVQRTRSQFDGLDEKQLIFELVKDICNDLDVVSLNLKILKNVSLLTNADRCSLFLVKGEPGDPNRHFVPTLFDVSSKQPSTSSTATTTDTTIKLESIKVPWGQGIVGYVAESGESVIIDDCYKDSRFSDLVDQMTGFKTRNMLCSPIFDNFGQVMGVAQVINKLPRNRFFTLDDQRIFNQYLQFCGIGLRNAQLFERSQLENKRNQVLLDLARMVFEEQSTIEQIVYRIIVHLQSLLGCERCQVLLVSESDSQDLFNDQTDNGDIEISPIWSQYECDQHESRDGPVIGDSNSRTFSRVFDLSMDDLKESESSNVSNIEGPDSNNNKANEGKEVDPVSTTANSHSSNFAAQPFENRFPINIGITGYVAATGETLNIPNAYQDARFDTSVDAFDPRGFVHKSILCMPIRNANRRIIGVSQLVNKLNGQPFNKNDENLFESCSKV